MDEHIWKLYEDQSPSLRGTSPDRTAWKCCLCGTLRFDVENCLDSWHCQKAAELRLLAAKQTNEIHIAAGQVPSQGS